MSRVIVCGSRSWLMEGAIRARLSKLPKGSTVIHGGCAGPDIQAGAAAMDFGFKVVVEPARWDLDGRAAGPLRNQRMLSHAPDLVIAFWDGNSRGTLDMINRAKKSGVPVEVHRLPDAGAPTEGEQHA